MLTGLFQRKTSTSSDALAHDAYFNQLRNREYPHLSAQNHVYLDYTGGNMYAQQQLKKHNMLLRGNVFGNPHSTNPTSQLATQLVEDARKKVLEFFNAEDYYCIFTPNASGALKIVGECYPFSEASQLLLLADNHNSVNGIREYCRGKNGAFTYATIQYEDLQIDATQLDQELSTDTDAKHKLFAYPAQSNVSGVKHTLDWIKRAQSKGWDVLLDAAAFAPTTTLDLTKYQPDFVTISFYKIFGYPTGLGCLLVKKDKFHLLKKPWFAGGTVTLAAVRSASHFLAPNHERFENGTINYLDIPAIKIGLEFIEEVGLNRINERVTSLAKYVYEQLTELRHDTGAPQVRIFGPKDRSNVGGTLIMTFFDSDNALIPFEAVEQLANKKRISIRSGCFCNPGLDEVNNCVSNQELARYFSTRTQGDYRDMIATLKKMRGATRVSVGLATTKKDVDTFLSFVRSLQNKTINALDNMTA
ncbi:MAG: aminotransferase class V-fold PLP-dependent enzyme [Marinirhabdus sp.]|nr:aminotransferase class V-fold PLP-dependent enzyme [Marinirhabdus sp.]